MPPTPAVEYRRATPADVPRFVNLPRRGEAGGDPRMLQYLMGLHHPRHALAPRAMWVAEAGSMPVGYVAGHLSRRFGCEGELQWIYVVPEHRGTAVASTLLRLLAAWFIEQGARRVCVDVGDDAARPFYRRHGAEELGEHWMMWEDISALGSDASAREDENTETRRATRDLSRKLDEVEAEMRRIGYWHPDPPDLVAQVDRGELHSYLDAPTFELWLQALFLPNARHAVATNTLPTDSQVGDIAMRQYDYHSFVPEAQDLLRLLREFDDLVREHDR